MHPMIRKKLNKIRPDLQSSHFLEIRDAMTQREKMILKKKLQTFVEALPTGLTQRQKAALLYRVITNCIEYDRDEEDENLRYTYAGAMLTGTAVCWGISELYSILCNAWGVECQVVLGCITGSQDYHAWVQLRFRDEGEAPKQYQCDPTFDLTDGKRGRYEYFLRSDEEMNKRRHNWLPERYWVCPQDDGVMPCLPGQMVRDACGAFENMYSQRRAVYLKSKGV